jgi:hypothetical protein
MLQLPQYGQLGRLHLQPHRLRQLQSLPLPDPPEQPRERPVLQVPQYQQLERSEHANTHSRATHADTDTHPPHTDTDTRATHTDADA